ncbi:raffinose/stachyose/melibiose transport system permease protein [Paramicrobacterium humi]|uniref:Raffinose/stachyose/melibiose transport system permease protein n=2 Tax=Paramicrobacterium humi TaxID=640635 RepID=A0A1H4MX68_9MICO|nr:raffinose/stachyose/melibiose transport system permease protein [Microbacterium humi]
MVTTVTERLVTRDGARPATRSRRGPSPVMVIPALVFFAVFALIPLVGVLVLSFMSWDGLGTPTWAGIDNWLRTLSSPETGNAAWLSFVVMIASWLIQAPISLLLGVFTAGRQRYRAVLSVLYFLPLVFSAAAVAIAFKSLLDPNFGLGSALGLDILAQNWLGDPKLALGVVLFVIAWSFIPFHTLLYQAGVKQIPVSLYEAAMIDGASVMRRFWAITIPQLRYTIVTSSTLMLVGSLTYFDLIYVLTAGGPGNATRILPLDMYLVGFRSFDMGRASVIAVILVAVGLTLSLILNRMSGASRMESQMEGA